MTAFVAEVEKRSPSPLKQKSMLSPEASAILERARVDAVRKATDHMDRLIDEMDRRNQREAEDKVRSWDRANDEFKMWDMESRIDRLEQEELARRYGLH